MWETMKINDKTLNYKHRWGRKSTNQWHKSYFQQDQRRNYFKTKNRHIQRDTRGTQKRQKALLVISQRFYLLRTQRII